MRRPRVTPWRRDSNETASGKPGAVHGRGATRRFFVRRAGRVSCAIDTLLSGAFDTISDARDETQRRLAEVC